MIKLENINKSYGDHVIFKDFSLEINQGEIIAIYGKSGSGKSTLLNIIGLIEEFDSGTYLLNNKAVPKANTEKAQGFIRENISYLFQNFALVDSETVEYNMLLALYYSKLKKEEKKKLANDALKRVGLDGFMGKKVFELSGGEQQRVSMARAMIKPSKIILADEPTGSLDEGNRDNIVNILKEINNEGKTILIVSHDKEIAQICDRVIEI